jgi:uncharacterized protein YmfQ (DUF2313 family)
MDSSAYLSQWRALLPPGDALAREPGSVLERLLTVPAAEWARVDGRVEALLAESDPARTAEMLADWERALGLPDECYPNESFSRASRAWYFDGAGVLREAAVDEPRYLYDANGQRTEAVLVEGAATNFISNPACVGAVPGAPGTVPLSWSLTNNGQGLNWSITGVGTESGIPYIDVRFSGTSSGTNNASITPQLVAAPAAVGEEWTASFYIRRIAGSLTGINLAGLFLREFTTGTAFLGQFFLNVASDVGTFLASRRILTATVANASTGFVDLSLQLFPLAGATVDVTLRVGLPQLEKGSVTSPILPPPATTGPTTRAADIRFIATTQERRARVLARLIERFEPIPAAIIGLAARLGDAVTLTEFTPHDCEDACEAPLLDEPWAHAFQVAGGAQLVVEFTCEDGCETPLSQWRTGAYECAIRRFAPAHTVPIFTYA